ncbi:MAG: preprotein translocase subunit SecA [Solirubrobacteraceae bacterium]|nr:preprotein translocase subunit SecA [Solirubrobacteraceae bacterium]
MSLLERALRIGETKQFKRFEKQVGLIGAFAEELELETDDELRTRFGALREQAENGANLDDLLVEVFAITREAGRRALGMRHFDVQLIGGMALHSGSIAEMRTGEGKTLTGTLPVVLNAIAGKGVHVVTVNDYLARRDAEWMAPLYNFLGLSVGILQNQAGTQAKHEAYGADITYGTNSEFGFDYLRDNMASSLAEKVQRSHFFAMVDEVDNILIDEARTPLIISGAPEQAAELYVQFAKLARTMKAGKVPEGMDPRAKKDFVADFDFEFEEKHKTVSITERGVAKAEKFLKIENLYSAANGHLVNHLQQALKAESLYKRDVDYAVVDGEVAIIDEFTGRILSGRRWSEGLHQAVEAKEGVRVQEENQTLATVTYQNYFRLYDKLAGMTGTAMTEATEFMKIYELPVVEVPTNRPVVREDGNDQIFKTQEGKWTAVVNEIERANKAGQPVLVGTISVEVSELLGHRLAKKGIKHTVLNAKPEHAAREGETVAEAGQIGAVTIATNMAGRGVDIKLGGNAEHLTKLELVGKRGLEPGTEAYDAAFKELLPTYEAKVEKDRETVMENGGLAIIGTERHESRRIDNQLRGRAGRQGDPGSSQFFLSGEDELVRLFAGDRIYNILDRFGETDEDGNEVPIQAGILSKQIEKAQRKVEEQNFLIRKRVLEYDDVMNEQRRVVYKLRDSILAGENLGSRSRKELRGVIEKIVAEYTPGDFFDEWDIDGLWDRLLELYPVALEPSDFPGSPGREELVDRLTEDVHEMYDEREEELGPELMRELERFLLLQIIDDAWREHLHDMDYLREGIHLRGFAQIEPIIAYKNEAFTLFQELVTAIWTQFAQLVFNVQVEVEEPLPEQPTRIAGSPSKPAAVTYESGGNAGLSALAAAAAGVDPIAAAAAASAPPQTGDGAALGENGEPLNREQRRQLAREQKKQAKKSG